MLKSPFDGLPPPDPKKFREVIKRNVKKALSSLARFSDSVRAGRAPQWPPESMYSLFMAQLDAFRIIWKRRKNARAIQLIRDMDHRWRGLSAFKTLENCARRLNEYLGTNLLGDAIEKAQFERANDDTKDRLVAILRQERFAEPEDLDLIKNLLPPDFQSLVKLGSGKSLKAASHMWEDTPKDLRIAIARSAQLYLISKHQTYLAKIAAAKALRQFLFDLKYRPFTKQLFGFSEGQIKEWDKVDSREKNRLRKKKFDQKKRAKRRYRPLR
jgi:hypothetical protein